VFKKGFVKKIVAFRPTSSALFHTKALKRTRGLSFVPAGALETHS